MTDVKDLESRDYDVNDIVEDKRFIRCKKEMWMIVVIGLIQILVPAAIIYSLNGNGKWFFGPTHVVRRGNRVLSVYVPDLHGGGYQSHPHAQAGRRS